MVRLYTEKQLLKLLARARRIEAIDPDAQRYDNLNDIEIERLVHTAFQYHQWKGDKGRTLRRRRDTEEH